jgi:isopentenyl-diphosphate Delta-isomerase
METIISRKKRHFEFFNGVNRDNKLINPLFDEITLIPNSFVDLNVEEIDFSLEFMDSKFNYPIFISSITGGMDQSIEFNQSLAKLSGFYNIPMGLGSMRILEQFPEKLDCFNMKKYGAKFLGGNLGCVQVCKMGAERINSLIDLIGCDLLFIHLNPLQELAQPNGDRDFFEISGKLKLIIPEIKIPVIFKETGCGLSFQSCKKIKDTGALGIETGGAGGTSFLDVEMENMYEEEKKVWEPYLSWGIPTAVSIVYGKKCNLEVIGGGGVRNGLHIAKSIVLGAKFAGVGAPWVNIWFEKGEDGLFEYMEFLIKGLKIAMALTGSKNLSELSSVKKQTGDKFNNWIKDL